MMALRFSMTLGAVILLMVAAACARLLPGEPAPSESPGSPSALPSPTPCPIGGGAGSFYYGSFEEFAAMTDGVAVVRVVSVGDPQYSTDDGQRPSCDEVADATDAFTVGRLVEVEMVSLIRGAWPAAGNAMYWLPGGTIDGDITTEAGFGLADPVLGELAVAFLLAEPLDLDDGEGSQPVHVGELFAADATGRVLTPDPTELILIEALDELLGTP